jgi:probable F420-dependent oxidoreductase
VIKPIRFGVVASGVEVHDLAATAKQAEGMGFSSIALNDHFNSAAAPMLGLQAMAAATSQIRIATSVLNQDLRHPAVLAKEAATLDVLSGGRLELGLGAGWVRADYDESGIGFDTARTRIGRLEENIAIIRGLFGPDSLTFRGDHYTVADLSGIPKPAQPGGPPIMVGGGGRRLLSMAAERADIVQVLGAALGTQGAVVDDLTSFRTIAFEERLDWMRSAAGTRFDALELSLMLVFVAITDNFETTATGFLETLTGAVARYGGKVNRHLDLNLQTLLDSPVVAIGTLSEVCEKLVRVRNTLGFNYFVTPHAASMEALAPIVTRLTGA